MTKTQPTVICVAPNGARRNKNDHPSIPLSPDELAAEALECVEAGASVIHLHVRGDNFEHSLDKDRYRTAIRAIRRALGDGIVIQVTTEAVGIYQPSAQRQLLQELCPQAASVAIRELIPDPSHEEATGKLFEWSKTAGVALQYIVYTPEEANQLIELVQKRVIVDLQPNTLFVLGRYTSGQQSSPTDLLPFLKDWPKNWPWSVCAFGSAEALCMSAAVGLGGNVRVGFENNLQRVDGSQANTNADLVRNISQLISCTGRPIARVDEARAVYGVQRPTEVD